MRILKRIPKAVLVLAIIFTTASSVLYFTGNMHLFKAIKSTYLVGETGPTILDYNKFQNREIKAGKVDSWVISSSTKKPSTQLLTEAKKWETEALLVVQDKKIIYESYWGDLDNSSLSNSFSMAKSFVSIAIGVALKQGLIESLDQKVSDFIPEFEQGPKKSISIRDLLSMSSGIDFGESYGDPFGFMAKAYYGTELYELTVNNPVELEPGQIWKYQGGNTLLLSFIIQKASGISLAEFFEKEVWQKVGAEKTALWTISEEDKRERSYCCFYSNARDFARVGQMYLDSGKWNNKPIVEPDYIAESIKAINIPNSEGKTIDYYGLHWWLGKHNGYSFYYARGILGQYIVIIPQLDLVLVRLGKKRDPTRNVEIPEDLYTYLDIAIGLSN